MASLQALRDQQPMTLCRVPLVTEQGYRLGDGSLGEGMESVLGLRFFQMRRVKLVKALCVPRLGGITGDLGGAEDRPALVADAGAGEFSGEVLEGEFPPTGVGAGPYVDDGGHASPLQGGNEGVEISALVADGVERVQDYRLLLRSGGAVAALKKCRTADVEKRCHLTICPSR
ncbi:hypothetical protein LRD17_11825 [Halorhodospira halochloris]|nr:hypothetical protein [Halorhodospira halochloris]MCG5549430.1 hypothetical protein [Halorhodospira halochloris]